MRKQYILFFYIYKNNTYINANPKYSIFMISICSWNRPKCSTVYQIQIILQSWSINMGCSRSSLPEDVVEDILTSLPEKSVIRFKCLNKSFSTLSQKFHSQTPPPPFSKKSKSSCETPLDASDVVASPPHQSSWFLWL